MSVPAPSHPLEAFDSAIVCSCRTPPPLLTGLLSHGHHMLAYTLCHVDDPRAATRFIARRHQDMCACLRGGTCPPALQHGVSWKQQPNDSAPCCAGATRRSRPCAAGLAPRSRTVTRKSVTRASCRSTFSSCSRSVRTRKAVPSCPSLVLFAACDAVLAGRLSCCDQMALHTGIEPGFQPLYV